MAIQPLATTSRDSIRSLAFKGILVWSCFPQIHDMVLRRFDEEHALIFSRPVEEAATGKIDWYAPYDSSVTPVDELDDEGRKLVLGRLRAICADIGAYGDELVNSGDPLRVTRGNILKLALNYPDSKAIFAAGDQPVLTCWGCAQGTGPMPQPAGSAHVAGASRTCILWWLAPALASLLLFWLLFTSFGALPPLGGKAFFHLPLPPFLEPLAEHEPENASLEKEIATLRQKLDAHVALCVPPTVAADAPKQDKTLEIPQKARDASFLEGSWMCETGLASRRTGSRVQFAFSFGADGKGSGTVLEKNDQCHGNATATLKDGTLHIGLGPQKCAKSGNVYESVEIECANAQGHATVCKGKNADGSTWNAVFLRQDRP